MKEMLKRTMKEMLKTAFIIICAFAFAFIVIRIASITGIPDPDVTVHKDDELVASTVCGTMYAISHKATLEDFQTLLLKTSTACDNTPGVETSFTNPDGSLKHCVIIGDKDTVRTPGSVYDTCIINWELTPEAAEKAFSEVCLARKF